MNLTQLIIILLLFAATAAIVYYYFENQDKEEKKSQHKEDYNMPTSCKKYDNINQCYVSQKNWDFVQKLPQEMHFFVNNLHNKCEDSNFSGNDSKTACIEKGKKCMVQRTCFQEVPGLGSIENAPEECSLFLKPDYKININTICDYQKELLNKVLKKLKDAYYNTKTL